MRVLLALLLVTQAGPPNIAGEWVGVSTFIDTYDGGYRQGSVPVFVSIVQHQDGRITGDFRAGVMSGPIHGRIDQDGTIAVESTVYSNARHPDGTRETERCVGLANFTGAIRDLDPADARRWVHVGPGHYKRRWYGPVLLLTAPVIQTTLALELKGKGCAENIRDLTWVLDRKDVMAPQRR